MFHVTTMAGLKALCAAAAATALMAAAPAQAEEAPAAPLTVAAELPAVDAGTSGTIAAGSTVVPGDTDQQFAQLFSGWESLVSGSIAGEVSVPAGMPLEEAALTSGYGMRDHPILHRRARHKGIDLAAPVGTPVHATADGIVSRADRFSSYGLYVSIEHGAELETRYAHMSRLAVHAGERVHKGEIIGYVGTTGRSTGPHLHYEVRLAGEAVNPAPYMIERETGVALALAPGEGGIGGAE